MIHMCHQIERHQDRCFRQIGTVYFLKVGLLIFLVTTVVGPISSFCFLFGKLCCCSSFLGQHYRKCSTGFCHHGHIFAFSSLVVSS
jgi:hypothetical protein